MRRPALVALLLFAIALPAVAEGLLPNVSEPEDLETFLNEMHANLIQVRESLDPRSPVLYEIHTYYIPQLTGERNPEVYRSGPVLFIGIWSPEMGEDFGFFAFEGEHVTMGSASGFNPSYSTVAGKFGTVHSSSSNATCVLVDENTGDVGVLLPPVTVQYGLEQCDMMEGTNPLAYNDGDTADGRVPYALDLGNYVAARSEDASTMVAPVGGSSDGGNPGDPLRYVVSELDLSPVLEAAVPWLFSTVYGEEAIEDALDLAADQGTPAEGFASLPSKSSSIVWIFVHYPAAPSPPDIFNSFGGIIPATGQVEDVGGATNVVHWPNGQGVQPEYSFDVVKHFCSAGSCTGGTFDIKLSVKLDTSTHFTTATWIVISGTGAYQNLSGSGTLAGIPDVAGGSWSGITDIYKGTLSNP